MAPLPGARARWPGDSRLLGTPGDVRPVSSDTRRDSDTCHPRRWNAIVSIHDTSGADYIAGISRRERPAHQGASSHPLRICRGPGAGGSGISRTQRGREGTREPPGSGSCSPARKRLMSSMVAALWLRCARQSRHGPIQETLDNRERPPTRFNRGLRGSPEAPVAKERGIWVAGTDWVPKPVFRGQCATHGSRWRTGPAKGAGGARRPRSLRRVCIGDDIHAILGIQQRLCPRVSLLPREGASFICEPRDPAAPIKPVVPRRGRK